MANYCEYKMIVKGKKNACYAFCGSTRDPSDFANDYSESGNEENFTLVFSGCCKWGVDAYCDENVEAPKPIELPDDCREAFEVAQERYINRTMKDRSQMFGVEVLCNSKDEDPSVDAEFRHYLNGKTIGGECPDILKFNTVQNDEASFDEVSFITQSDDDNFMAIYITSEILARLFTECQNADCLKAWDLHISGSRITLYTNEPCGDIGVPRSFDYILKVLGIALSDDILFNYPGDPFKSEYFNDEASVSLLRELHLSNKASIFIEESITEARMELKDSEEKAVYEYSRDKNIDKRIDNIKHTELVLEIDLDTDKAEQTGETH